MNTSENINKATARGSLSVAICSDGSIVGGGSKMYNELTSTGTTTGGRGLSETYQLYVKNDLDTAISLSDTIRKLGKAAASSIKKVIFNDPATIIIWADGTKTIVKCENEPYDPEKGMAMCIAKRFLGNKGNY